MSTMTSRLIAAGYVLRETDPVEARSNTLTLTPLGLVLVDDIKSTWSEVDRIIEKLIGVEKSDAMASVTGDLCRALGGRAPDTN